jgi:hypothetical protein
MSIERVGYGVNDEAIGVRVLAKARDLSILHTVKLSLRLIQPIIKWAQRTVSPEEKRRRRETDHSPPPSAEVTNFRAISTVIDLQGF